MSIICPNWESSNQVVEEKGLEEGHINNCRLMIKKEETLLVATGMRRNGQNGRCLDVDPARQWTHRDGCYCGII